MNQKTDCDHKWLFQEKYWEKGGEAVTYGVTPVNFANLRFYCEKCGELKVKEGEKVYL